MVVINHVKIGKKEKKRFLNLVKTIYKKPTVNITLNGRKIESFLLIPEARQGCSLSPFFSAFYCKS